MGLAGGQAVLNFCSNNYLGLSSHPAVVEAGVEVLRSHGAGVSSVRFICGTQVCPTSHLARQYLHSARLSLWSELRSYEKS